MEGEAGVEVVGDGGVGATQRHGGREVPGEEWEVRGLVGTCFGGTDY